MPKPENQISFTELSALAHCETKWHYRYQERLKGDESNALWLGKLVGNWTAELWRTGEWHELACDNIGTADGSWDDEPWATASWIMERYERHYADELTRYKTIATELELTATLPNGAVVIGFIDQVIESPDGKLWIVERKTMNDWRRLDWVSVDPQLTIYAWLARENGYEVAGIIYDAIRTYRWKREAHPDHESFQWLWLDRTDEQLAAAVKEIEEGVFLREQLRRGGRRPLHNIGTMCGQCSYQSKCFEALAFPTEVPYRSGV